MPLWTALNGRNEPDSPYRRMIVMAAADASKRGSEIDAAARAIGVDDGDIERWLVQILEAWRDASPGRNGRAVGLPLSQQRGQPRNSGEDPGASRCCPRTNASIAISARTSAKLAVVFDLEPRPDKSPLAYTDFLTRGRERLAVSGSARSRASLGTYPTGGLFSLNELVHESGHAVHVSAIHTRPAYMDWPDTLFTEAFADVPSWSVTSPRGNGATWARKCRPQPRCDRCSAT